MTSRNSHQSAPSINSRWHSIRPWTGINRLSLQVREITSVSVTFILSSSDSSGSSPLELDSGDEDDDGGEFNDGNPSGISDTLGRGLAVKVNGLPWEKVVMHVDEDADEEAIIILYGLMPSRVYEVELSIVAREQSIMGNVTTEAEQDPDAVTLLDEDLDAEVLSFPSSSSSSVHQSSTRPSTPPPRTITLEERVTQLRHTLAIIVADRDALTTQLKSARRESQRADAALRSEIEALKRASEKNALTDQRGRQKIRALQEAVKQSLSSASDTEEQVRVVEESIPGLEERAAAVGLEHGRVAEDATRSAAEREETVKSDRKKVAELEAEVAGLTNKLDKLNHKKEKLAKEAVPELEEQLAALSKEIDQLEKGTGAPLHDLKDFDHAAHYPHHYLIPAQPPPPPNLRPNFPPPIQRPQALAEHSLMAYRSSSSTLSLPLPGQPLPVTIVPSNVGTTTFPPRRPSVSISQENPNRLSDSMPEPPPFLSALSPQRSH